MWPTDHSPSRGGALHGVRVVDLTRVLAGPLCTQMLSDHGADVIKIEPPSGDETRTLGPPFDATGNAAYFGALNRGKRAMALDLAQPQAREVLMRLLEDADVLVDNFLPGTMEKWGLGYKEFLSTKFPRLVCCSISGFGTDGPLGGMPGYDAVLQAMCGLMSINGDADSGPTRIGVPVVDHLTAYVAHGGILMALRVRDQTGKGQRVEAALFDTAISLLVPHAANWMTSGKTPGLLGSAHPNISPYDKYQAQDALVFIGILNDAQFKRFCTYIGRAAFTDDARFCSNAQRLTNRDALKLEIEAALTQSPAAQLCDALMKIGVPASPVNSVPQALSLAHTQHRAMVIDDGSHKALRSPARLTGTPAQTGSAPPTFAMHSQQLLHGIGYTDTEIEELRTTGAAPSPKSGN